FSGLLKTRRVLRSRYGRLHVQFGETLRLEDMLPQPACGGSFSPSQRRALVQRIAQRAVHEIQQATVVTATALASTALLIHRRRGMVHDELVTLCTRLVQVLVRLGARVAPNIRDQKGVLRPDVVREAVRLLRDGRLLTQHDEGDQAIYAVPDDRR